jgi:NAD-dependent dihydropyrimidine dehydrogenase PreA subunit
MTRILYCHCAHARVLPPEVKAEVLDRLAGADVEFEAVPDLCEMAARGDERLRELAADPSLKVAACYPRAVKWLFAAAGADLPNAETRVLNMRTQSAEEVATELLGTPTLAQGTRAGGAQALAKSLEASASAGTNGAKPWKPWFPVIDYTRCTNCMQCLSFCLFDVYGVSADKKIQVQNQSNCKTDCPACSRVCPEVAILFPKYKAGPINGDVVNEADLDREKMKVDISALLGGDIYAALRQRSTDARARFSRERDEKRALDERKKCLTKLQQALDIPPEVLAALPSREQIEAKTARLMSGTGEDPA